MKTRVISVILVIAICLSFLSFGLTQVSAYSTDYPNTHKNTGNQVYDLISVAKTQVGYTEYYGTKYGAWLGNSGMAWCAAFISWCANQAGIPKSVINPTASVGGFVNIGAYHFATEISGYVPSAGDIMLFRPLANSSNDSYYTPSIKNGKYTAYSHVAIVVSADAENGTVTIIDGNWSHAVKYRTISLYTYYIAAYVTPQYETGYDHSSSANNNIYYSEYIGAPTVSQTLYPTGSDVKLKWDSLKGATSYKVRIYDADGERIYTETVSKNSMTISGLEDGIYKVTVTASFSGLSGNESSGTEFSIQNIANGQGSQTVKDGIYIIKLRDNGYTLGTINNEFILSRSVDISSAQRFNITHVADGKYKITDDTGFNNGGFISYDDNNLFYILEQSDGSYTFESVTTVGNVLSCGLDSVAANYCMTTMATYLGVDTQKWDFYDTEGNIASVKYTESVQYVTNIHPFVEGDKLTLNITTPAYKNIEKLKVTVTTLSGNFIAYASEYTQVGNEYIWSVSTSIPSQEARIIVGYKLTDSDDFTENYFSKTLDGYDTIIHSTFKDISYTISKDKVIVKVTTPATDLVSGVKISFADVLGASIASTDKYTVRGDKYVWTIEMNAPSQDIDIIVDYRYSETSSYAKDYYQIHIDSYESTIAQGVIKSVHQSVVDDKLTFIIKTTKSIHSLRGIMAIQLGNVDVQAETMSFIEAEDSYIWTITLDAPTDNTSYRFYPLIDSEYVESEDYTLNVFVPDTENVITSITHTIIDNKLIFRVTTPCTDDISRVKLALANECSSNIVTCSQPVKVGNSYVWELTVNEPQNTTAFCFDVRYTETSKYSRNYYYYQYTKSQNILNVSFDTSSGNAECTVTTKAGSFSSLTVSIDGKEYSTDEYSIVDNTYVWVVKAGAVSDGLYSFDLRGAITEAYIKDYYLLYI